MIVADEQAGPVVADADRSCGRHRLRWAIAALAIGAAIAMASCASRPPTPDDATTPGLPGAGAGMVGDVVRVVIMSSDAGCGPREVKVTAPGPLAITFHNHGASERTLTVEGIAGALTAEPHGGETTGTFTLERPEIGRATCRERV